MEQDSAMTEKNRLNDRYIIDHLQLRNSCLRRLRPSIILHKISKLIMSASKFSLKIESGIQHD